MIEEHLEVTRNRRLNENTWLLGLRSPELAGSARPGQFVMVRVRGGVDPLLRRPLSICGVGGDLFFILYRVVGKGTEILSREVREGDRLSVIGPLGAGFRPPSGEGTSVLVAGGIGIAPLLFLASTLKQASFRLLAGFGSARELIPAGDFLNPAVTPDISTDDGSAGHHGLVTDLLEERLRKPGWERPLVFACGPRPMLKTIASMVSALGLACQVSLEATMACGLGACQGCAVRASAEEQRIYYHVCKDGPVFEARAIDWEGF